MGTFWISHGRASKRYWVEVSAPTGQSSITLPLKRRAVGLVLEGGDQRLGAAVARHELAVLGDVGGEARAAVAEDAALAVERDRRRDRDRLVERPLREAHPRRAGAVLEGQVLERALAALVADRAVERVVDEDELERRVLALGGLRGGQRPCGRPSRPGRSACSRPAAWASPRPRRGTSGRRRPAARAGARSRRPGSRSRPRRPSRRGRCPSATSTSRPSTVDLRRARARSCGDLRDGSCVCWSTGASTCSSDELPCIGQPLSRCSWNSARNLLM